MRKSLVKILAALSFVPASTAAYASNVEVTVFETIAGVKEQVANWTQDQNPTPEAYVDGFYTTVPVFGAEGLGGDTAVTWYSGSNDQLGGFTNYHEDFNVLAQTSYASAESNPVFLPGAYHGVDVKPDYTYLVASYTIAVLPDPLVKPPNSLVGGGTPALFHGETPAPAAVPEPGSWAMMLAGLGMIGIVARRRSYAGRYFPLRNTI